MSGVKQPLCTFIPMLRCLLLLLLVLLLLLLLQC
jgi:hypothetical protein